MTTIGKGCVVLAAAMVAGSAVVLGLQHQAAMALRSELSLAREKQEELTRLKQAVEQARLQQLSPAEMENLREDHAAVERVRAELKTLKDISQSKTDATTSGPVPAKPMPLAEWRNAGNESPRAAFETALWAAANGDPATLAGTIELSIGARKKAEALFAGLSEELRTRYESPEKLVALLAAQAIKVTAMTITREQGDDEVKSLEVVLQQPDAPPKRTYFGLHRVDAAWRLVVPESAVDTYAARLKALPEANSR